jgi:adenylylsulfate kinase-like enzyme
VVGNDNFIEIYIDTPLSECERRDVKGLYAKARNGEIPNFTGISSPYESPKNPDIIIKTTETTVEKASEIILQFINKRNK